MNAANIFSEYSELTISFLENDDYGDYQMRDYFETVAADGEFDEFEEFTAWLDGAKEKFPDADDLNLAISAFVSFFWNIEGNDLISNDDKVVVTFEDKTLFEGQWCSLLEKYNQD